MTENTEARPEALRLAAERPYSIDDDLYAWAQSAEQVIRDQHADIQQLKAQLSARQAAPNPWQQAIDHELVCLHLGVAEDTTQESAAKALRELIQCHVEIAINPQTNGGLTLQPHGTPPPPEREPLTELQITAALMAWFGHDLVNNDQMYRDTMRDAINAAHGIGATND